MRLQVSLKQALDAVAHGAVLHRARVLQPHLHLHPLGNLRGHTVKYAVVLHLAAEPRKRRLRLVPVELSLALGHPALLLALQLLAERGHAS